MVFVIHWHESAMDLHVSPIQIPPPTSLSTQSLWVFPMHQAWALVSCIPPGLVTCFTLDNIHVSMLFSRNIPSLPSPTESTSLTSNFYSVSSVARSCLPLCGPTDCSTVGLPVLHYLLEFAEIHFHWVGDAIQHLILCHPLLLLPSIFPSIRLFSNESTLLIMWPKY